MIVVTRYVVPVAEAETFRDQCRLAVQALVARPGCTGAWVSRAIDDPQRWTLTTTWTSVGAYRRALSGYEVKIHAVPLMYRALDEPTAYEDLLRWSPDDGVVEAGSGRAADADEIGLGQAGTPHAPRDL